MKTFYILIFLSVLQSNNELKKEIRQNLSSFINIDIDKISCKATTTDHLGFEGKLEGISCHCVVLIDR